MVELASEYIRVHGFRSSRADAKRGEIFGYRYSQGISLWPIIS
jgi:hypothetical protein